MEIWQLLDSRAMGGIEKHVLVLTAELRRQGHDARIVLLHNHGRHVLRTLAADQAIPVACIAGWRGLNRALLRGRPDLLHTHGYKAGLLGRPLARLHGCPVVSTFHNGDRGRGKLRVYTTLDRWTGPLAGQIAVSNEIAGTLSGKAWKIDNFVPVVDQAPVRRRIHGDPIRVAFVGRLSHEKGIDRFCALARTYERAEFHVFGDGPMRAEAEQLAGNRAVFHGMVSDISAHWEAMDLLCMPSRREGLPMAALEAMASGLPVLACAVGGLPDLITDGADGWLCAPDDPDCLARTLDVLVRGGSCGLARAGEAARQVVIDRFGAEQGVGKILRVYEEQMVRAERRRLHHGTAAYCSAQSKRTPAGS